ncbi:hypothetical protein [Streptomyces sp. NPDC014746]|uniref:hypothetical protein n=1 Tax=Streptomyces sp. NPDC014746 TaxID=3364904 RepID=UPI003700DC0A
MTDYSPSAQNQLSSPIPPIASEVALPFEKRGIELSHRHDECSFETSLRVHRLTPARGILCSSMTARVSGGRS